MIPNGKEMKWQGHHLVFESEPDQCRGCFFADKSECPDCDEGAWVEQKPYPWHTGTPAEEGFYLVYHLYQPIPNSEEKEALYHQLLSPNSEDGYIKWVDIDGQVVFGEEEVVRWQKIEPYKEVTE